MKEGYYIDDWEFGGLRLGSCSSSLEFLRCELLADDIDRFPLWTLQIVSMDQKTIFSYGAKDFSRGTMLPASLFCYCKYFLSLSPCPLRIMCGPLPAPDIHATTSSSHFILICNCHPGRNSLKDSRLASIHNVAQPSSINIFPPRTPTGRGQCT